MQQKYLSLSICAVISAFLLGCGGPPTIELDLAKVSGTVTLDSKPLPKATVIFHPDGGGKTATGHTDSSGKYSLTTSDTDDGAIVGKHKVTIVPQTEAGSETEELNADSYAVPDPNKQPEGSVPAKYASVATSGLEADVKAGENNAIDFPLTSK